MGLIRFLAPRRESCTPEVVERAYIVGLDEVPWSCRIVASEDGLIVDRPVGESGCLHIPWHVDGFGETVLSTGNLMERDRPYLLELELARGTLNRIRNQLANWEFAGMVVPEPTRERLASATEKFARAATSQDEPETAARLSSEVLRESLEVTVAVGAAYAQQALALRHATGTKLVTMLGANLGSAPLDEVLARNFLGVFNSAVVPAAWRQVEKAEGEYDWKLTDNQIDWCQNHSLRICGGPLIQFDGTDVPDWLYLWEEDVENVMTFINQYVRAVVGRYRGRVNVWQAAARISAGSFLGLAQQHRMRMVVRVVELIRELDAQTPVVLTFDQPWGEFLSRQETDLPLMLADTLVRSNLGLAGVGLEINVGYYPGGSYRRDVIEFSRQLDRWSMLGLPLLLSLVVPGGNGEDPRSRIKTPPCPDDWTSQRQEEWVRRFVPVALGKQAVQAVIWNQFCDQHEHGLPHGGLIDAAGKPRPALTDLLAIRKAHLS